MHIKCLYHILHKFSVEMGTKWACAKQIGNDFEKMCLSNLKNNSPQFASIECVYQNLRIFSVGLENVQKQRIGNDCQKMCIWHLKNNSTQFDAYQMFVPKPTQI